MFQKIKNTAASLRPPSFSMKKSEKPSEPSISWSITDDEPDTIVEHIWTIANFSRKMKMTNGEKLYSSAFAIMNKDTGIEADWYLTMNPNGSREEDAGFVSLFLHPKGNKDLPKKMSFAAIIPCDPSEQPIEWNIEHTFENTSGWGTAKFVSHKKLKDEEFKLLPNDTLTIVCQMIVRGHTKVTSGGSGQRSSGNVSTLAVGTSVRQYMKDIGDIYGNGDFTDFTIICHEKEFPCHQVILAARSSVFHAMFTNDMDEKRKAKVQY